VGGARLEGFGGEVIEKVGGGVEPLDPIPSRKADM